MVSTDDERERTRLLLDAMTIEEKALQMQHMAPAIERLSLPSYNWWNEGLHGVARAGVATVFPQAIGLAAIWNPYRIREIAQAISTEARAKHHEFLRQGDRGQYKGLTYWSPNINIFRDPRWGRGQETYGECPYLTARLGVAFCEGLQGDDPHYYKVIATPKHFAVHSGPEAERHSFDAEASEKDLFETYLPAFHACITEARAGSIMAAYNRTNGEPCCASQRLLVDLLRKDWGFSGFVVSDCWAIKDFHEHHGVTRSPEESAALAVKMGCDLNCGCTYEHIPAAIEQGLLSESEVDICLERLFLARQRLGMFDADEKVPYASIPYEENDSEGHRQLALVAARESLVLLENDGILPLSPDLASIAVIGPNADDAHILKANYFGDASTSITPLEGIRQAVSKTTKVWTTQGCKHTGLETDGLGRAGNLSEALSMAQRSDVVVLCLGLSADIEGEQGDVGNSEAGGDKVDLRLPGLQERLMKEISALGKPVVLVVLAGSPIDLREAAKNVSAILYAWYPGARGGRAIAEAIFGQVSPAGRLPITFPESTSDLPPMSDYKMEGRTYRYARKRASYPFGFGLSYSRFHYADLSLSSDELSSDGAVTVSVRVANTGATRADEVAQLYVHHEDAPFPCPVFDLRGFSRINLAPGESKTLTFQLDEKALSLIDEAGKRVLVPGRVSLFVGGSQPDERSVELMGCAPLRTEIRINGTQRLLPY